ncbi:MAG: 4-(cytidine 5'-diphospho)-2-C-methyl-D-erythritol kinase [Clostridia bacterium]
MKKATYKSFAKINLTLDVLGKLENGYHEVKMVMQSVSLFDTITIETSDNKSIEVSSNLAFLPTGSENLAYKAAEMFYRETGIEGGANISLNKHIPVGAGLAGGSSNCATVLKALNKLYDAGLSTRRLCQMGVELGADVPYCILGGTRLAEGIGERLSPLPRMPYCHILLVKPAFSISTKAVYEKIDNCGDFRRPDTDLVISGLRKKSIETISRGMGNVLEEVSINDYPVLDEVKKQLMFYGARSAQMSGSGPTVFGIFTDRKKAENAKKQLWGKYKTVYLCNPV